MEKPLQYDIGMAVVILIDQQNLFQPGHGSIKLTFTGILNDKLRGFYRSKYTTDGEDRYAAVTQFAVRLQTQVILVKRQTL